MPGPIYVGLGWEGVGVRCLCPQLPQPKPGRPLTRTPVGGAFDVPIPPPPPAERGWLDEMSAGRVPLRVLCVRDSDGTGLWFMAADGQLLGLPKTVRTMIDPDGGSTLTGLSPGHRYRYRLPPAPAQAKFRPVDRLALHRLALAQQQPARVRPPSLAVGGSATCFMFDAEWAAEVRADPFLSALATG